MAIVRQDAGRVTGESTGANEHARAAASIDWAISRRKFLVGAGVSLAATSTLGPWLRKAVASPSITPLPDGFTTGVSDAFEQLAQGGGALALNSFDALVAANAQSIRFPIDWGRIQSTQGAFDWSYYDAVYREIVFHGLTAHPVLVGCPEWVGINERKQSPNGLYYPTGSHALNAYGEFAVEALRHFSSFGDHGEAIEVWSEPNNPREGYIADPSDFSRMLSTVALFVDCANADGLFRRPGDRAATVLAGGLYATTNDRSWEKYLAGFQEQTFAYQLALHVPAPSARGVGTGEEYAERTAEEVGAVVDRATGQAGREVWVTGTGATAQPSWGEAGQALAMGSIASALAERSQCKAMMVTGLQSRTNPESTGIETPMPMSGLLRRDGTPTSALTTLQTAWATP